MGGGASKAALAQKDMEISKLQSEISKLKAQLAANQPAVEDPRPAYNPDADKDLWQAMRDGDPEELGEVLVARGIDAADILLDHLTPEQRSAGKQLLLACHNLNVDEVLRLLATADSSTVNYFGKIPGELGGGTPILAAIFATGTLSGERGGAGERMHAVPVVEALVAAKADVTISNDFGRTPLHRAFSMYRMGEEESEPHYKIIKVLLAAGAHMTTRDYEGDTPYDCRIPRASDDVFGSKDGRWAFLGAVEWSVIEATIRAEPPATDAAAEDARLGRVVRALVDLGWGAGAGGDTVAGKTAVQDRIQLCHQILAPWTLGSTEYYLYYWDQRDGSGYQGWWIAQSVGSNTYNGHLQGDHAAPHESSDFACRGEPRPMKFVPNGADYVLNKEDSAMPSMVGLWKLQSSTNHGRKIWKLVPRGSVLHMDRCKLLTHELLVPLMRMAQRKVLPDSDELPGKQLARYLLNNARVATPFKEDVLAEAKEGLRVLEADLTSVLLSVQPALDANCGPGEALIGAAANWAMHSQKELHGPLSWLEGRDIPNCIRVLCSCGYTLHDIQKEMTSLGWLAKDQFYSSAYAMWQLAAAKRMEGPLKASLAQTVPGRAEFGPLKRFTRVMAKKADYSEEARQAYPDPSLFEPHGGHIYDVGGVCDLTRCTIECTDADDMVDVFKRLSSGAWPGRETVVRSKNGFAHSNVSDNPYRDIKLNVHVPADAAPAGAPEALRAMGTIAEVQLVLRPYLEAKKHMHVLYEVVRGDCFA